MGPEVILNPHVSNIRRGEVLVERRVAPGTLSRKEFIEYAVRHAHSRVWERGLVILPAFLGGFTSLRGMFVEPLKTGVFISHRDLLSTGRVGVAGTSVLTGNRVSVMVEVPHDMLAYGIVSCLGQKIPCVAFSRDY